MRFNAWMLDMYDAIDYFQARKATVEVKNFIIMNF